MDRRKDRLISVYPRKQLFNKILTIVFKSGACKKNLLTHSLIHNFKTVLNSKKLQTTTEMWLLKVFSDTDCIENIVGKKGEIAHFEQFHLFPQCFPKVFFFSVLKRVCMEKRVNPLANDLIF